MSDSRPETAASADAAERFDYEAAADARAEAGKRPSRLVWPGLPIMFLAAIVTVDVTMLVIASNDTSFAVAEDYALGDAGWEAKAARHEANAATGWTPEIEVHPGEPGLPSGILVTVTDAAGTPVEGASVRGDLFHHAAAGLRRPIELEELRPGVYQAFADLAEDGRWGLDLRIERGDEAWIDRTEFLVLRGLAG